MADLIPGMTEIMDHIKKLEAENKELKQANKMLNSYNEANIKLRQEKEDKIQELKEENEQQQKWFEEINELLEAKAEDPCVVVVEEYVRKMKINDKNLTQTLKYGTFLEYRLDKENIDYSIPDDYEERSYENDTSEEEDD